MNFSSALLATLDGEPTVVCFDGTCARGRAHDGTERWQYAIGAGRDAPIVQPQQIGPHSLIMPLGEDTGIARIETTKNAAGVWEVRESWRSQALKPSFNDFVFHNNCLFGFDKSIFACADAGLESVSGNGDDTVLARHWRSRPPVRVLPITERGEVVALDVSPDESVERGRLKVLSGKTWNDRSSSGTG